MHIQRINSNQWMSPAGAVSDGTTNNKPLFKGNVSNDGVDHREKVNLNKKIKEFVKENKLKKLKQPGGDSNEQMYENDKYGMIVSQNVDGTTITFLGKDANTIPKQIYYYDAEGHLTKEVKTIGDINQVTEYLPNGRTKEYYFDLRYDK